ncbi:MAG: hypothetical protein AAF750_15500 [Planctomycetota bacterium]
MSLNSLIAFDAANQLDQAETITVTLGRAGVPALSHTTGDLQAFIDRTGHFQLGSDGHTYTHPLVVWLPIQPALTTAIADSGHRIQDDSLVTCNEHHHDTTPKARPIAEIIYDGPDGYLLGLTR